MSLHGRLRRSALFKVPQATQSRAIRDASGSFLKNLRGVPKCGVKLVAIVEAFGNVANSHLKFLDSKNDEGSPPKQATRIEPYEPFDLSADAQRLYDELLRYGIPHRLHLSATRVRTESAEFDGN